MREASFKEKIQILGSILVFLVFFLTFYNLALNHWALRVWNQDYLRVGYFIRLKNQDQWKVNAPKIQVLFLGDSTGEMALDPRHSPVPALNLSVDGTSNITAYYFLKDYLAHQPAPRCVIYSNSGDWRSHHRETFDVQTREGILNLTDLVKIWSDLPKENFEGEEFNQAVEFWSEALIHGFHLDFRDFKRLMLSPKHTDKFYGDIVQMIGENRGYFPIPQNIVKPESQFYQSYHEFLKKPFQASKLEDHYLQKMIRLARDHGIRFKFLFLPVADTSFRVENAKFFADRELYLRKFLSSYPEIEIWKPLEFLPRSNFVDFSHMNENGAPQLMEKLSEDLKSCF